MAETSHYYERSGSLPGFFSGTANCHKHLGFFTVLVLAYIVGSRKSTRAPCRCMCRQLKSADSRESLSLFLVLSFTEG